MKFSSCFHDFFEVLVVVALAHTSSSEGTPKYLGTGVCMYIYISVYTLYDLWSTPNAWKHFSHIYITKIPRLSARILLLYTAICIHHRHRRDGKVFVMLFCESLKHSSQNSFMMR